MSYKLRVLNERDLAAVKRSHKPLRPRSTKAEVSIALRAVREDGVSPHAASEVYGVHLTTIYRQLRGGSAARRKYSTKHLVALADKAARERRTVREVAEEAGVRPSSLYRVVRRLLQSGTWDGTEALLGLDLTPMEDV